MDSQTKLEIEGRLEKYAAPEIFAEIAQAGFSGSLRLSNDKEKIVAYFENGEGVFAVSNSRKHRLFEILLSEDVLTRDQLVKIEGFTNDLHLAKSLVSDNLAAKDVVDSIIAIQIKKILKAVWKWERGNWIFSPLARIKEGVRYEIGLHSLLGRHADDIEDVHLLDRFKSMSEVFSLRDQNTHLAKLNPSPNEAFILSRISGHSLTVDELRSMCGLPNTELFGILYRLWMKGAVNRMNWSSFFTEEEREHISDAKLTLRKSATSFEEELEKAAEEEALREQEEAEREEAKQREKDKGKAPKLTLDSYLDRVEDAATHYELFDVTPKAEIADIKKIYFSYAKNFHPDLFYKKVEEDKHEKIQRAFTDIAKAYDTLKDEDSREVYDFKLRKVIEAAKKRDTDGEVPEEKFEDFKKAKSAAAEFDSGYQLLMNGKPGKALHHLERAVKLDTKQARYHAYFGKALSFDKKQRHKAEGEIQTALKMDRNNSTYRMMLAELFYEIGLIARAKGELKRIIKSDPGDQEARSLLDRLSKK